MDSARVPRRAEVDQILFCAEALSTRAYETYPEPMVPAFGFEAAPFASGTREVLRKLSDSLFEEIVDPFLGAVDRDGCAALLRDKLAEFVRTMDAIRVVVSKLDPESIPNTRDSTSAIVRAAQSLFGSEAIEEAEFSTQTYASAMRILRTLRTPPPEKHARRDHELISLFEQSVAIYQMAAIALVRAQSRVRTPSEPVELAMEMLRHGALSSYSVVREAADLRILEESESAQEWLPFDAEDHALAMAN